MKNILDSQLVPWFLVVSFIFCRFYVNVTSGVSGSTYSTGFSDKEQTSLVTLSPLVALFCNGEDKYLRSGQFVISMSCSIKKILCMAAMLY